MCVSEEGERREGVILQVGLNHKKPQVVADTGGGGGEQLA